MKKCEFALSLKISNWETASIFDSLRQLNQINSKFGNMNELLETIWRENHDQLFAFIYKRIKNKEESEDILQEVFIKILSKIGTLKERSKLQSWVYQMTRNAIIDYIRKKKFQELEAEIKEIEDSTDENAMNEATSWIGKYLDDLPENYREAVVLYEMKGLSQKEIAGQLGFSYSNARSRVQRGRMLLKKNLTDCCSFNVDVYGTIIDYHRRPKDCSRC
jgi:RNA polymerase sigma-70 factor, ECF subfamily